MIFSPNVAAPLRQLFAPNLIQVSIQKPRIDIIRKRRFFMSLHFVAVPQGWQIDKCNNYDFGCSKI